MGTVDLHVHTIKSHCGLHTLLEILELARQKSMSMLAITDHTEDAGTATRVLGYRFPETWNGIRVLKGIEFSIRDGGKIEVPGVVRLEDLDICLAGFHGDQRQIKNDPQRCTDDLQAALAQYPFIDVLTHPTIRDFGLQHERTADLLARHGVAVEVNNSALRLGKEDPGNLADLLKHCVARRVPVVVNSDTHTAIELGEDQEALRAVGQAGVPDELVLTSSPARVLEFIERRRKYKHVPA